MMIFSLFRTATFRAHRPRGHAHVHHHDIGPELGCFADCRQPVGRLAGHLEVRLRADHHGHACPHAGLVTADRIGQWTFCKRNEAGFAALKQKIVEEL
jgi:hypothetical protein